MIFAKNNKIYEPINGTIAKLLVENSSFHIYFVHLNSKKKSKTRLDKENVNYYCDLFESATKRAISEGGIFIELGNLPSLDIKVNHEYKLDIKLSESLNYMDLNFNL